MSGSFEQLKHEQRQLEARLAQLAGVQKYVRAAHEAYPDAFANKYVSDPGPYGDHQLSDIARHCVEETTGKHNFHMNNFELFGTALCARNGARHGLMNFDSQGLQLTKRGEIVGTDLPVLLENLLHKVTLGAYKVANDSWRRITRQVFVKDFRPQPEFRSGSLGVLGNVPEGEEYQYASVPDAARQDVSLGTTKGNLIRISREALVNDDLGVLNKTAVAMGKAAALSIEKAVFSLLSANSGLGNAFNGQSSFFNNAFSNINGTGSALSAAAIDGDRTILASQTDPSGNELLNLRPFALVLPIGLTSESLALNNSRFTPGQSDRDEPAYGQGLFRHVIGTPYLTGTRRYILADPEDAAAIVVAFLAEQGDTPVVFRVEEEYFNGATYKIRFDYQAQYFDPKGAVTNAGA